MSKKVFLKKTFADAVKGLEEENSFEDGSPGESVINPQLCIFKYTNIKAKDSNEPTFPLERRKKATQKSRPPMKVEEDLEEVIEIMSSPEKSPFKKHNDSVQMHLNRSKIRRQIIPLCDDQDSDSSNDDNKDVVIHVLSSDTDSLPSLYDPALQKEKDVDTDFEMEDEKDEEEEEELEFKKFQGQMHFDLYQAFTSINRGLTADEILNVLLSPHGFSICETVPQYVQTPSGFLLDTRKLKDAKDVRADGNGAWKAQTKPKRKYKINSKGKAHIARDALNSGSDNIYEIIRSYSTHKETSNFRRLIIEVNGSPFIILQYYFIGPTVPVLMKPHGNSKQKTAPVYRRVAPSSLQRMTNMANSSRYSTKSVIKNFIEEEGGIENIHAQDIPRNEQQIRNLKRKMKDDDTDEITEILHEFDVQRDNFIRKIDIRPDFIVVLASDQQLKDLNRFCTRHPCSILGIDPTFHFGEFDVTVTTYRNPMLQDITPGKKMLNTSPVFVGPVCVHKKKDTQTYFTFFSTLIAKEKELRNMKAIGTDGEVALANASLMAFESATQLRCFNHIQMNIKNKLQEIGVSKENKKIVISDIFGSLADTALRYAGLVDCLTNIEFDQKLETLQEKWDTLSPNFYMWFKRHYADNFKSHVIQSVRNVAGLSRSECYTTNDNESMNSALQKVCGKNKTLPSFLKELKDFIKTQENQISLAIVQQGHLRLKEEFQNLEVPISIWATWDPSERKKHISKVNNYIAKAKESCSRIYTPLEVTNGLSSSPDSCGITDVQENIIKDFWEKAERLLQKEFSIVSIPEYPDARRVSSLSNPKTCHFVEICRKTGNIKCECHLNKLHKICHHVLAVAENAGVSDDYLQWRQKKKTTPSLSLAVNTTLPKSAGRKPNEKRGWAKKKATCTKPSDLSVIDPFQVDTENNYIFRFLENTRIMVCYGCGKRFRSSTAEVPNPPFDIVLAKKEYRNYVNELGQLKLSLRREFVHYHINTQCILKKDLLFDGQKILVTHNVTTRLSEEHREFIQERLGLQL